MAVRTKTELVQQINSLLADNSAGEISAADIRSVLVDVADSLAFSAPVTAQLDALPPWATIILTPPGIVAGADFPASLYIAFIDKLTSKTVSQARLVVAGTQGTLHASTPLTNIEANARHGGVLRFNFDSTARGNIKNNAITSAVESITAQLTLTFSDGTTYLHDGVFLVNNPALAIVDATARAAAAAAGPVIIVSNIASFDATQDRFEDSSGNEVVVPDGSIVTLTQAVYDAAVTDAEFTPNANAIFLTR